MLHRLVVRSNLWLRLVSSQFIPRFRTFPLIKTTPKLLLCASPPFLKDYMDDNLDNIDLRLKEACDMGQNAVLELLDALKIKILDVSKAYRNCLKSQMEVMKAASKEGALSAKWHELPKFRTLGNELNNELNNILANIKTIGLLAQNDSMVHITQQKKLVKLISQKYKELEKVIQKQVEEIKKLEASVLKLSKETIDKTNTAEYK